MTRKISTYEDLIQEEHRLTLLLSTQKEMIGADIAGLKESLNPIKKVKTTVRNLFVRDDKNGPAINFTLNFVLDYIIRKIIPNRTSVLTKTIIPFMLKNYAAHLITDEQRNSINKTVSGFMAKIDGFVRETIAKTTREAQARRTAAATSHYEA